MSARSVARRRPLSLLAMPVVVLLAVFSGCAFQTDTIRQIDHQGKTISSRALAGKRVWFRRFDYQTVAAVSTAYATGPGGSASGIGVSVANLSEVPPFALDNAQEAGLFESVTPLQVQGEKPQLILEGSMKCAWDDPWWNLPQLVVLWIPAWFFPTLGRNHVAVGEMRLYDGDYHLLHKWTYRYEKRYIAWIWWMMSHGGAYDTQSLAEMQPEVAKWVFEEMRKSVSQGAP